MLVTKETFGAGNITPENTQRVNIGHIIDNGLGHGAVPGCQAHLSFDTAVTRYFALCVMRLFVLACPDGGNFVDFCLHRAKCRLPSRHAFFQT